MLQNENLPHVRSLELPRSPDAGLARGADWNGDEGVFVQIGDFAECLPELTETFVAEVALEDALFNADAVAFAAFGNALQPAWIADVVGDDAKHGSG